jgi:hypothetical protein
MKFYLSFKILFTFICLIIISGCQSESVKEKSDFNFVSVHEESWNESSKNMYKIYLSMMKIDSLSADLNLKFTRKNSQGL